MSQPVATVSEEPRRSRLPLWVYVVTALMIGAVIGGLIIRQRAKAGKVLVSVGQSVITQDALFNRLQSYAGIAMMHKMVEEELQIQFAKSQGVTPGAAEVNEKFAQLSSQPDFENKLAASGETADDFKHGLLVNLAQQGVITKNVTVTEADARKYYQDNINSHNPRAQFYTPLTITLRAVVTTTRAYSMKAMQALNSNMNFAMVAHRYNLDQSKATGGLLPPIQRGRTKLSQVPALENAIFALKVGEQLGPVQVGNAWWIVRCEEKAPAKVVPYAKAHADCLAGAKLAKGLVVNGPSIQKKFREFEQAANLQAFAPQYQAAIQKGP